MLDIPKAKVVKRGKCLYYKAVEYNVVIVESDVLYSSGDYEDPPEISDDRVVLCYYGWFDSPGNSSAFCSGTNGTLTIEEAIRNIEIVADVCWLD